MKEPVYLATDIGATGIKLVAAAFDGTRLEVKDSWSVKNGPIVGENVRILMLCF